MAITLVVKGDASIAKATAAAHAIPFTFITDVRQGEVRGCCPDSYLRPVMEWFMEDDRVPYPKGSLLFYDQV